MATDWTMVRVPRDVAELLEGIVKRKAEVVNKRRRRRGLRPWRGPAAWQIIEYLALEWIDHNDRAAAARARRLMLEALSDLEKEGVDEEERER